MRLKLTVNGERREVDGVWEGESLLYVLRERLGFPGSKNACEQGECGSCSVSLDGVLVCACLVLSGQAEGREVVTVEGIADGQDLHPVQEAFVEDGGVSSVGDGRAPEEYSGVPRIDGSGCLATPGLVNCHHHLYQWATRGLAQQATLFEWLVEPDPTFGRIPAAVGRAAGAP